MKKRIFKNTVDLGNSYVFSLDMLKSTDNIKIILYFEYFLETYFWMLITGYCKKPYIRR